MKYIFTLLMMVFLGHIHAQEARSPFRKGYMRPGINNVGEQLDLNILG